MLNTVLSSRTPADGLSTWRAANTPASSSMTTSEPTAMDSVAAHFQREASRLLNASDLVADPTSMTLIQQDGRRRIPRVAGGFDQLND